MILYIDFEQHAVSAYPDAEERELIADLEMDNSEGTKMVLYVSPTLKITEIAYTVDGEFHRR